MPRRHSGGKIRGDNLYTGPSAKYYDSEYEAVKAWSEIYRNLGIRKEYAAFVYSARIGGAEKYYAGRTYSGMGKHGVIRANVVIPFIYLYLIQSIKELVARRGKIAAFLHTHPNPPSGFTCRHHSAEDLFLLKLPRINAVYVIPYENQDLNKAQK